MKKKEKDHSHLYVNPDYTYKMSSYIFQKETKQNKCRHVDISKKCRIPELLGGSQSENLRLYINFHFSLVL